MHLEHAARHASRPFLLRLPDIGKATPATAKRVGILRDAKSDTERDVFIFDRGGFRAHGSGVPRAAVIVGEPQNDNQRNEAGAQCNRQGVRGVAFNIRFAGDHESLLWLRPLEANARAPRRM